MLLAAPRHSGVVGQGHAGPEFDMRGGIPPGGRCDVQTLAAESQVARAAFYGGRPYEHLRKEFERRIAALRDSGEIPDPRDAQIARLKEANDKLKARLAAGEEKEAEHDRFRKLALSRLAAQHDEIERLRALLGVSGAVLPIAERRPPINLIGPC
ncbi:hypothetical protein ACWC5I_10565 [Kitasatospora sp. NPDC001574]